jgi:beta-1,4-mannooligosaccharide/beta-1,4-mannosyl-N-acetylglucosamine phosphorylase
MIDLKKKKIKASEASKSLKKYFNNPILHKNNVPYESELIFNAGVTKFEGKYVMAFRNDYGKNEMEFRQNPAGFRTSIGLAFSDDGICWQVQAKPCFEMKSKEMTHAYDPRLTVIDGRVYMCFAVNTPWGVRGGIAVTDDFDDFEILTMTVPDNRNMVLFPEKINDKFIRLERPFPVYGRAEDEAFDIWISQTPDCRYWGEHQLLLGAENVSFCNCKIGPAAPPVKTSKGWLTTFHAVKKVDREIYAWHSNWNKIYYGGLMLLDLNDPTKIIGMCKEPILVPEQPYEKTGFRGEVIFPGGMILEDSGEVKIYYGAADTVECLATAHVDDLLELCKP